MLKHIFKTDGRAGRLEYIIHSVADVAIILLSIISIEFIESAFGIEADSDVTMVGIIFVVIAGMAAELCVTIRRFHDLGMTGWTLFATIIPIYNIYLAIILLFKKGEPSENQYGPNPISDA